MSSLVKSPNGTLDQGAVVTGVSWPVVPPPSLGMVLTNRCDFANGKVGYLMIAGMVPAKGVIQGSDEFLQLVAGVNAGQALSETKWKRLSKFLDGKIFNKDIARYFLLEADALGLPPLLVDFQLLTSVPYDTGAGAPQVVGELEGPDREHLITRFAAYSMRIGVERLANGPLDAVRDHLVDPWLRP